MTSRLSARNCRLPRLVAVDAAAVRALAMIALGYATVAASPVGAEVGMYGEPSVAAQYWREQSTSDCGEMAVADVVGEITGHQPTEREIVALAERTPGAAGHGPIWQPMGFTDIRDLPILLSDYGITADNVQTDVDSLKRDLSAGRRVIAIVNAEIIWNRPTRSDFANHFVVVTGIDTRSGTVHLNDSAMRTGRDEKVTIATFERAWAPNHHSAIVTR